MYGEMTEDGEHLEVCAAMVDDNISYGLEVAVMQRSQALAQFALGAIGAVEGVQVSRQVPLRAHTVTGWRQPHTCDA